MKKYLRIVGFCAFAVSIVLVFMNLVSLILKGSNGFEDIFKFILLILFAPAFGLALVELSFMMDEKEMTIRKE